MVQLVPIVSVIAYGSVVAYALGIRADAAIAAINNPGKACDLLQKQLPNRKVQFSYGPNVSIYENTQSQYYSAVQAAVEPVCIIYPKTAKDVSLAVKAVKKNGADFAIKAGGQSTTGWSTTTGVLIDLGNMTTVKLNTGHKTATYGPGVRWSDIYTALLPTGQMAVGTSVGNVGTGASLGGGLSQLSPQYGLSCDSFLSLEVVLPSGKIVTATAKNKYNDLFWGLKGGGNTLGVVTSYHVRTHKVGTFYSGIITVLTAQESQLLSALNTFATTNKDPKASVSVSRDVLLSSSDVYSIHLAYNGPDPGNVFAVFDAVPHIKDNRKTKPYTDTASTSKPPSKGPNRLYRAATYSATLENLNALASAFGTFVRAYPFSSQLVSLDIQLVPQSLITASKKAGGNALQSLNGPYYWVTALIATDGKMSDSAFLEFKGRFDNFMPASTIGLPLHLNDAEDGQAVLQSYGDLKKLRTIKKKYDPDNLFAYRQGAPRYVIPASTD